MLESKKNGKQNMKKTLTITLLLVILLTAGCNSAGNVTVPTEDVALTYQAVSTEAAETVFAEIATRATATSLPPTETEIPTATPTEAPTDTQVPPTNTAPVVYTAVVYTKTSVPNTATLSPTPAAYSCLVTASSPANNTQYAASASFDGVWVLKNNGTMPWYGTEMDLKYISGQKMQSYQDVYDLGSDLAVGSSITFTLDMTAPSTAGTYTMTWGLSYGDITLCTFGTTIIVK
jgi:hypothetical protein